MDRAGHIKTARWLAILLCVFLAAALVIAGWAAVRALLRQPGQETRNDAILVTRIEACV